MQKVSPLAEHAGTLLSNDRRGSRERGGGTRAGRGGGRRMGVGVQTEPRKERHGMACLLFHVSAHHQVCLHSVCISNATPAFNLAFKIQYHSRRKLTGAGAHADTALCGARCD